MSILSKPSRASMVITKSQLDAAVTGINWVGSKPTTPLVGDAYYDARMERAYVFDGFSWSAITADSTRSAQEAMIPTQEKLDKHPALKQAWEEYVAIKRLLGL